MAPLKRSYPYLFFVSLQALINHEKTAKEQQLPHYRVLVVRPGDKLHRVPISKLAQNLRRYLVDIAATHALPPSQLPNGQPHPLAEGLVRLQATWEVLVARDQEGVLFLYARRPPVQ